MTKMGRIRKPQFIHDFFVGQTRGNPIAGSLYPKFTRPFSVGCPKSVYKEAFQLSQ